MDSPTPRTRVHFVDVLRLLALAQMVNGHTLYAVLHEDLRQGDFYHGYLWFRGLVSVAFMLVAGLSFHITTVARLQQHRRDPAAFRRRVMRALLIIAIGFVLRLPLSSLLALDLHALWAGLRSLSRIDVLPCIGVSLLMLEGLTRLCTRPRQVVGACLGLSLVCALATPWGAGLPTQGWVGFITGWLGPQGGSAFPLLPYSGYVFAGVVLGAFALPNAAATPARVATLRLTGAAGVLFTLGALTARVPGWLSEASSPLVHTPSFFVTKLAAVTLATAGLSLALRRVHALPGPLRVLTGETLAIYVFHLLVLYGYPFSLHTRIGTTLSLPMALSLSALMLTASTAAGLAWHRIKHWQPTRRLLPSERATLLVSCSLLLGCLLLVATRVFAEAPINTNGTEYAIAGHDPVAYFTNGRAQKGSAAFEVQYQGATWRFASEANRRAFQQHPERYAPRYGGHCAFAAAQESAGKLVGSDLGRGGSDLGVGGPPEYCWYLKCPPTPRAGPPRPRGGLTSFPADS